MKPSSPSYASMALLSLTLLALVGFVIACGDSGTSTSADLAPVVQPTSGVTALAGSPSAFTPGPGGGDREPPAALVEACAGISVGSVCSFVGREGNNVAGTCSEGRGDSGVVLCRPNDRPDRGDGPSREERRAMATAACTELTAGVSCTIDGENHSIAGTCRTPPEGESLFCVPDERRREP